MDVKSKVCLECGVPKPADPEHFYVKRRRGGLIIQFWPRCKPCYNSWTWQSHGKAYAKRADIRIKENARDAVLYAVQVGKLIKPSNCHACEKQIEKKKLEAHHQNGYADPLDVIWLCRSCHTSAHKSVDSQAP